MDSREPSAHLAAPSHGLGERVRDARTAKGWTQGDLAGADFSVGYISRIESGARHPSRVALVTLAARLGVSTDFLITGAEQDEALSRRHDLDRAELALAGGDIATARVSVSALIDSGALRPWPELHRRAQLVHALAREAEGDTHAAIIELEDLYAATDDDEAAATLSIPLSRCYRETSDFTRAIEIGQRGLESLQELGLAGTTDHIRLSVTVAAAYFEAGQVGVATRLARRAIAEAEAANSPEAQAAAYWNASIIERHAGRLDSAVKLGTRAVQILQTGHSTRNLGRMRTQLALFHVRQPDLEPAEAQSLLELAGNELQWSAASPLDLARHRVVTARLHLRQGDPRQARAALGEVFPDVCHQDALLAAEMRVLEAVAETIEGAPVGTAYDDAATLLELLSPDRGAAQLWFELGEAAESAGDRQRSADAFRQAAMCLGASRTLLPTYDRAGFSLTTMG